MKNMDLYVECYGADHPLIAEVARLEAEVAGLRALLEAIRVAWVGLNTGPKPGVGWWANDIDNALAAQPAAPEEVCGCGVLWNAAIHSEQYDPEVADFHAPYPPDQPAAPCRCNVGSCFTHPHNPGCAPHGHTVQPAAPEAEPERCCHGYRAPR